MLYTCVRLFVQKSISINRSTRVQVQLKTYATRNIKQGVALNGRNSTVPPCSDGRRTGHAPGPAAADRPRALYKRRQTADDADRRQRAKQYCPLGKPVINYRKQIMK